MKRLGGALALLFATTTVSASMLSSQTVNDSLLLSEAVKQEFEPSVLMSTADRTAGDEMDRLVADLYEYDESVVERLDLSLTQKINNNALIGVGNFAAGMDQTCVELNLSLASIYAKYLDASLIPLKDPLWMVAIGSVEYNYTTNDPGVVFSFPVDVLAAKNNPNYLLEYGWQEVQRLGGDSAVLRRDGSSIGMFQLTKEFGTRVDPVIPEDFGMIGCVDGRRTDCWLTLGDGTSSGASIIWKPGVNGDRWSPADCANVMCAVYDSALRGSPLSPELNTKYEQAVMLMWAHNRGTGIMNKTEYIAKSKALAQMVPGLCQFVETLRPVRFIRSNVIMEKVKSVANATTDGDEYPVMALMSYLVTEARYAGKW